MTFAPDRPDPEYGLVWPSSLLRSELSDFLANDRLPIHEALELLFEEAFAGRQPIEDLTEVAYEAAAYERTEVLRGFAQGMLNNLDGFPLHRPRQYWANRQRPNPQPKAGDRDNLQLGWQELMSWLVESGYLDRAAGDNCSDTPGPNRDSQIRELLGNRAGLDEHLWIGTKEPWRQLIADDEFYTLVEVMHDLVARPRTSYRHPHCGQRHYGNYNRPIGQALYRWQVNDLFDRSQIGLRLAAGGNDTGLLVQTVYDPRQDLLEQVDLNIADGNEDRVGHAIALYRGRGATVEDKRSACTALAHVLENRERLIRRTFNRKDEDALFNIANNFGLRHHDAQQRPDYHEDYLDWIFWWYLATVELTNRLLTRDTTSPPEQPAA